MLFYPEKSINTRRVRSQTMRILKTDERDHFWNTQFLSILDLQILIDVTLSNTEKQNIQVFLVRNTKYMIAKYFFVGLPKKDWIISVKAYFQPQQLKS